MLREKRIQSIRSALVQKMEELWSNAGQTISKMKDADGNYADPFDQAATDSNKYVELVCRGRERELMLDIKETIMRIDKGLFGTCDHCSRTIHEERLRIEPMSRLCIECKEEEEINHKRRNRQWPMKGISYNHV